MHVGLTLVKLQCGFGNINSAGYFLGACDSVYAAVCLCASLDLVPPADRKVNGRALRCAAVGALHSLHLEVLFNTGEDETHHNKSAFSPENMMSNVVFFSVHRIPSAKHAK